jgi:hypothetical protein
MSATAAASSILRRLSLRPRRASDGRSVSWASHRSTGQRSWPRPTAQPHPALPHEASSSRQTRMSLSALFHEAARQILVRPGRASGLLKPSFRVTRPATREYPVTATRAERSPSPMPASSRAECPARLPFPNSRCITATKNARARRSTDHQRLLVQFAALAKLETPKVVSTPHPASHLHQGAHPRTPIWEIGGPNARRVISQPLVDPT